VSVPLHHVVSGPSGAPTLLLGNSLGTTTAMWDAVVSELGDRVCVVRFDHRGQGASPVVEGPYAIGDLGEDVVALLDELEIDRAAFCGVSLGGMVGLWLAANTPQRVSHLIACCTSAQLDAPQAWAQRAAEVRAAGSTAPIADAVVARWVTPAFAAARPDVAEGLRAMLLASPAEGYASCCAALEHLNLRDALERVRAPTLVVAGAQDEAIAPEHGEHIAAAIPGARFALLSPGAHIPMAERPADVAALILEHLELPV
jgi:3-oxoadipate enol-lactonase